MDTVAMAQETTDAANTLIGSLQPADLARSTPCSEWDVRGLVGHMIGVCQNFGSAADGAGPPADAPPSDASASELAASYRTASARAMNAWHAPGVLDRTLQLRFGEVPGAMAVGVFFVDQILHVWDLAKAVDRPYPLSEEMAATAMEMSRPRMTPDRRGPGKPFGEEQPCAADAPMQDRFAAFTGRKV